MNGLLTTTAFQLSLFVAFAAMTVPASAQCQSDCEGGCQSECQDGCQSTCQDDKDLDSAAQSIEEIHQAFVDAFRSTTSPEDRAEIIQNSTKLLNDLLAEHYMEPTMESILPKLVSIPILDADEFFLSVIDEHPETRIRALALLCFAKYCGNNERDEAARTALAYLKKNYGDVEYNKGITFGDEASEAFYFLENLSVGKKAPEFVAEDADGILFSLDDYRGQVVMLRFWGDWCPPCRMMYPYEKELVKTYKGQPFALIGVNSDSLEDMRAAATPRRLGVAFRLGRW